MLKNYLIISLTSCENLKLIKPGVSNPDLALLFIPLCVRSSVVAELSLSGIGRRAKRRRGRRGATADISFGAERANRWSPLEVLGKDRRKNGDSCHSRFRAQLFCYGKAVWTKFEFDFSATMQSISEALACKIVEDMKMRRLYRRT